MSYYVFAVIHLPDDLSLSLNMIQVFVGYGRLPFQNRWFA